MVECLERYLSTYSKHSWTLNRALLLLPTINRSKYDANAETQHSQSIIPNILLGLKSRGSCLRFALPFPIIQRPALPGLFLPKLICPLSVLNWCESIIVSTIPDGKGIRKCVSIVSQSLLRVIRVESDPDLFLVLFPTIFVRAKINKMLLLNRIPTRTALFPCANTLNLFCLVVFYHEIYQLGAVRTRGGHCSVGGVVAKEGSDDRNVLQLVLLNELAIEQICYCCVMKTLLVSRAQVEVLTFPLPPLPSPLLSDDEVLGRPC